jgi:anaerobic C4-dicarboxylate transporter
MLALWSGAAPLWAVDILIVGRRAGVSAAFFLILAYVCAFIVATGMFVFAACPVCGKPIRRRAGTRPSQPLALDCLHCGASPR